MEILPDKMRATSSVANLGNAVVTLWIKRRKPGSRVTRHVSTEITVNLCADTVYRVEGNTSITVKARGYTAQRCWESAMLYNDIVSTEGEPV